MSTYQLADRTAVLVLGCGDVGSAVAHRLFRAGIRAVLCDLPNSTHARRGMAFTDALFDGTTTLDGVTANHARDVAAIHSLWRDGDALPVVDLPEEELARVIGFGVAVDAIVRRHRTPPDRRWLAPMTIGLGPGFVPGANCHVAIETQWGAALGAVLRDRGTAPLSGGPRELEGVGHERFVAAAVSGLWRTGAVLGQPVAPGIVVGHIGTTPVTTPIAGVLRGLTRDGVEVVAGQKLLEVDPRATPEVFGLGERPLAVARGVCQALGIE